MHLKIYQVKNAASMADVTDAGHVVDWTQQQRKSACSRNESRVTGVKPISEAPYDEHSAIIEEENDSDADRKSQCTLWCSRPSYLSPIGWATSSEASDKESLLELLDGPNTELPPKTPTRRRNDSKPQNSNGTGNKSAKEKTEGKNLSTKKLETSRLCPTCRHAKENPLNAASEARRERAAATKMRRRLESFMENLKKERQDFETYKKNEMASLQKKMAEITWRQNRDRLAEESRRRWAQKRDLQKDNHGSEYYKSLLEKQANEIRSNREKYDEDLNQLHIKILELTKQNLELRSQNETLRTNDKGKKVLQGGKRKVCSSIIKKQNALLNNSNCSTTSSAKDAAVKHGECSSDAESYSSTTCSSKYTDSTLEIPRHPKSTPKMVDDAKLRHSRQEAVLKWVKSTQDCSVESDLSRDPSSNFGPKDPSAHERDSHDSSNSDFEDKKAEQKSPEPLNGPLKAASNVGQPSEDPDRMSLLLPKRGNRVDESKQLQAQNDVNVYESNNQHRKMFKEWQYSDGTLCRKYVTGDSTILYKNGDVRQAYRNGIEEYYWYDQNAWQVSYASGMKVTYFPCGRIEASLDSGEKDILLPSGDTALRWTHDRQGVSTISLSELHPEMLKPRPRRWDS